jgi:hypothetical protein
MKNLANAVLQGFLFLIQKKIRRLQHQSSNTFLFHAEDIKNSNTPYPLCPLCEIKQWCDIFLRKNLKVK